jgi:isoleucyl-tRNA synthetase
VATKGQAPYKEVLSHGFTLDGEGRKMSKSLGNVIAPAKVIQQYGADILRLWVASSDYQADVRISDAILKQTAEAYRKIRNTFRFLLGNLNGFDPDSDRLALNELTELDRYALIKLNRLVERVSNSYDEYDFHQVYYDIHHFCTVFLSQFYLDVLKDRLYVLPTDSEVRRSAQTVLYEVLLTLVKIINPILPHTTEEVWKYIPGDREISVQLCDFPVAREDWYDEALEKKWDELLTIRDVVLKALEEARAEKLIGNSLGATVEITPNPEAGELLRSTDHLDQLFIVSDVVLNEASSEVTAEEKVKVTVRTAEGEKCERCWVISPTVGQDADHPHLCSRCATIVKKLGVDLSE